MCYGYESSHKHRSTGVCESILLYMQHSEDAKVCLKVKTSRIQG